MLFPCKRANIGNSCSHWLRTEWLICLGAVLDCEYAAWHAKGTQRFVGSGQDILSMCIGKIHARAGPVFLMHLMPTASLFVGSRPVMMCRSARFRNAITRIYIYIYVFVFMLCVLVRIVCSLGIARRRLCVWMYMSPFLLFCFALQIVKAPPSAEPPKGMINGFVFC